MAIEYKGPGSWDIGGYSLPELNISETLFGSDNPVYQADTTSSEEAERIKSGDYLSPTSGDIETFLDYGDSGGEITEEAASDTREPTTTDTSDTSTAPSTSTSDSGGYSASEMLKEAGLAPSEKSNLFEKYGVDNTPDLIAAIEAEDKERLEKQKKQAEEIGKAWDPIINELDRLVGLVPQRETKYKQQLGGLEQAQLEGVGEQEKAAVSSVESTRKRGLRDLEEDIRNQMEAAGRFLGGYGAGSSSANIQATEAITRAGQRSRGELMETVSQKIGEIKQTAMQERNKIQQWKSQKLMDITQFFAEKMDQLNMAKAEAKGERAQAIEQLKFDLERDFSNRLQQLDNTIIDYATTLDQWERERTAQLEDYAMEQQAKVEEAAAGDWNLFIDEAGQGWWVNEDTQDYRPADFVKPGEEEPELIEREDGIYYYYPSKPEEGLKPVPNPEQTSGQGLVPDNWPVVGRF